MLKGSACADGTVLRRIAGRHNEPVRSLFRNKQLRPKQSGFLHCRVYILFKLIGIAGEREVFAHLECSPCSVGRRPAPAPFVAGRNCSEGGHHCVADPACRLGIVNISVLFAFADAEGIVCRNSSRLFQRVYEVNIRQCGFGKVCCERRHIIHLQVYVEMIVALPRRIVLCVPYSLQICRQGAVS